MYGEVKTTRLRLAERLRKLPLGYFGKRDLADLTETLMGDVNRMEHVWSHVLGYLYGAYISTAIIAVCLLVYDWRLAIACLWGVPVAFGLLFGSRRMAPGLPNGRKKRLSGFPTASRRHWRMCGRSAPPIRRNGIWKDSTEKLTTMKRS